MVKGISYPVKTFQVKMHKNEIKVKSTLNETKIQGLSLSLNTDKVRNKKKALEALENAIQSLKTEVT